MRYLLSIVFINEDKIGGVKQYSVNSERLMRNPKLCFLSPRYTASSVAEAYTQLVLQCVRSNNVDQAKRLQSHMERSLFQPADTFIHNHLLQFYSKSGNFQEVQSLFDKMPRRDITSWNALLFAYSKTASMDDLQALFNRMPQFDSASYNILISALSGNGRSAQALMFFIRMRRDALCPSKYTYLGLLHSCSQLLYLNLGKQIHGKIVTCNLVGNLYLCNALINLFANCEKLDISLRVFDGMAERNIVSWNSLFSGYMRNNQPLKCIELFGRMLLLGIDPDEVTVSNVLSAYIQCGMLDKASYLFQSVKPMDLVSWTTMIVGYGQNEREETALNMFRKMRLENIRPDPFTISSVISSCTKIASLFRGKAIHGISISLGVDCELIVSSALVDFYSKCGEIIDAFSIFKTMPVKNLISWNSMILGYAQNGQDRDALDLYNEMLQKGSKPDSVTFVGILSACDHSGLIDEGQEYFHSMKNLHKITPTSNHYACMINLFGHAGSMDKVLNLVKSLPYEPDRLIWSTLLSICALNGDLEHGEIAAKHLFKLDPLSSAPYIMLSNMYASRRKWHDVVRVRSLMKGEGVKKIAGCSWIDIENEVHTFVAEDRSHPEASRIYEELEGLIKKVKEAGFVSKTHLVLRDVGEDEKVRSICYHSEKLALAFGLMRIPDARMPIRIMKNIRVCGDCHEFMKFVSKIMERTIKLRDLNRFHHFVGGQCCCKDYW